MTRKFANFYGCLAILIWSFCPLGALFLKRLPIFEVAALTLCLSGILSGLIILFKRKTTSIDLKKEHFLGASLLLFINHLSYLMAFHYIPPEIAELCYYCWPFFLLLQLSFVMNRSLHMIQFASTSLGFSALCLLFLPVKSAFNPQFAAGVFLSLAAAFCWSSYQILSIKQHEQPPEAIGLQCGIAGFFALLIHFFFETYTPPTFTEWLALSCIGFGAVGCCLYFWRIGISKGNIHLLSNLSFFIPILSLVILSLFTSLTLKPTLLLSGALISLAAWLSSMHQPQALPLRD